MNTMTKVRTRNRALGTLFPARVARETARLFLSPRNFALRDWEKAAEQAGERLAFGDGLSAIRWGSGERRVLLMHGWESRATQMYSIAAELVSAGYEVIAIDAPLHGKSGGDKAHPVAFAAAIAEAERAFGPFDGGVGHSMGAAALAIARSHGVSLGHYVLISSPAVLYDTLWGFAKFMGLSDRTAERFIGLVEAEVGVPSRDLEVGRLLASHGRPTLLIHARDDQEVPYSSVNRIRSALDLAEVWSPDGLGHRKIVRDPGVAAVVRSFLTTCQVPERQVDEALAEM